MNTVEELIGMGMYKRSAENVVISQERRIGEEHGDFTVKDIRYLTKGREVTLVCRFCGTEVRKVVGSLCGSTWNGMQSVCECQRRAKKEAVKAEKMLAKAVAEERQREEIESRVGKEYGEYKVVGIDGGSYVVQCSVCGVTKRWSVSGFNARTDFVCHTHRRTKERFTEAYIGMKNNYLTVIGITWGNDGRKMFRCRCDCGRIKLVKPSKWENGTVVSCNCYMSNRSINADPEKRIKSIWQGMKRRCLSPSNKDYCNYGGRGITICSEWLTFENFLKWSMENGYDNTKTIDRKDSDGNYAPENCRWTNWDIQNSNRKPRKSQKYYEERKNGTTN